MTRALTPLLTVLVLMVVAGAWQTARAASPAPGVRIDRATSALDALIAKDAVVEKLADGYAWTEGPVWDRAKKRLLFSDVPGNHIMAYAEARPSPPS